jgi:hypothetical protein
LNFVDGCFPVTFAVKNDYMRLVQLLNPSKQRKVALVSQNELVLLKTFSSAYELVFTAINNKETVEKLVEADLSEERLEYLPVWEGKSDWNWLPCFDHPEDVNKCMVSGTGLTHRASAENRNKMNTAAESGTPTDSIKMYFMGEEGGKPGAGKVGVQAEWFYKGNGSVLKGHLDSLEIPDYGLDGGEEPEIAGIYVINNDGNPIRVGFSTGNEYSDHVMEKINYLYLAPSKIRTCSIGPELIIGEDIFNDLTGRVAILRDETILWEKTGIKTGEANMAHSLENLEYHHFKYANHRIPGQVHVHYFGTGGFSFGDGIKLKENDRMIIEWPQMGKSLINEIKVEKSKPTVFAIKSVI